MMAGKTTGRASFWTRRWVWTVAAALTVFAAGFALGAGSQGDEGSRCAALSHVETVVDRG